jgi:hypothetical protein
MVTGTVIVMIMVTVTVMIEGMRTSPVIVIIMLSRGARRPLSLYNRISAPRRNLT